MPQAKEIPSGLERHLMKTKEAAKYLKLSPGTLEVDRCTRSINIPFYKIGGAVRYDINDLNDFLDSRKCVAGTVR